MVLSRDGPAGGLIWCEMSWRLTPFLPFYHAISLLISNHSCHYDIYYAFWYILCIMIYTMHSAILWYTMHYDIYCALWFYTMDIPILCMIVVDILCLIAIYCILTLPYTMPFQWNIFLVYLYWFFCSAGQLRPAACGNW